VLATVLLKIAALTVVGFFVWSFLQKFVPGVYSASAMSGKKAPAVADASEVRMDNRQAVSPSPVPPRTGVEVR
jgi:hypothetical protein